MTVRELTAAAQLSEIKLCEPDRQVKGAYCGDLLSWVMGRAQSGNAWITIMSNINVIAVASLSDVSCVILAEGVGISADVLSAAEEKGINILSTSLTAYQVAAELSKLL